MLQTIISILFLMGIFIIVGYSIISMMRNENLLFQKIYVYLHDKETYRAYKEAVNNLGKSTYLFMYPLKNKQDIDGYYFVYDNGGMVLWKNDTIQLTEYHQQLIVDLMSRTTIIKVNNY